jgi:hypothetical protein|tara:strand:- start:319 stop:495 length:177 start_codon:yes stop_codon:yes gene_type:complete
MKQKIIKQIENVRKKNNVNWMDILRVAFKYAPKEAATIMKRINTADKKVSSLVNKLAK